MKTSKVYSVVELATSIVLVVIMMSMVIVLIIVPLVQANFWFTRGGVLDKLREINPHISEIVESETGFWAYSIIIAESNNNIIRYYLDTDCLGRHVFYLSDDWGDTYHLVKPR